MFGELFGSAELGNADVRHYAVSLLEFRKPIENGLQDRDVCGRTGGTLGMGVIAGNPAAQFQKLGSGVFVGGNRSAEGETAKVLQNIVQFIETRIAFQPVMIAQCEKIGREGRDAEQVVRAVHDHVNGEIVASQDFEVRTDFVAQVKAFPFKFAAEGGVLRADALFYSEQTFVGGKVIDLAKAREHGSEFEGDELRGMASDVCVGSDKLVGWEAGQPEGLEDGWDSAEGLNLLNLAMVFVRGECVPCLGVDECPCGESSTREGISRAA